MPPREARRAVGSQRPRSADVVADALRARILSGELAPGAPVREEELAATYAVSRHTARTALDRLAAGRLVTTTPYRGVRVAMLDDDDLVALQQLRCALEVEALRIARERGARPDAEAALLALEAAEAADDWPAVLDAHAAVHLALVDAAGSPRIAETYRALEAEVQLLLTHVRPAYAPGELAREHRGYVEAALDDPDRVVRAHLEHSTRAILGGRARASER